MLENFDNVYTSNVKKAYPFIINPDDKNIENYCKKHYKVISFFCFTCHAHFCLKCQSEHTEHSFQSFENLKMNENDITQAEITVRGKTSLLFKNYMNEKLVKKINEKKNEIVRFKLYIIDKYKNENNNFYNIYNFCYIFKLGALLKSDKNDLLKIFFAYNGFKMMIKKFNYFYEKQKLRWLLKNLVSYKKDNQIEEKMIKERQKKYNFENLDNLIKNEGFGYDIINTMKKIINEVKNRNDLKTKIYNFMIRAIDLYKKDSKNFLDDLETILKLIRIDFKEMVKEKAGYTEDVAKFMKSNNCSYYKENNGNNEININFDNDNNSDELDSYNSFCIKEYKSKFITLNITNKFIANNYNNKYENSYYTKDNKHDVLKLMHNIDKKIEVKKIRYSIFINYTNFIIANNYNNSYTTNYSTSKNKISENIWEEEGGNENKVNTRIEKENYIIVNNKDSKLEDKVNFTQYGIPNNYNFSYDREIKGNNNVNLDIEEHSINLGNKEVKVIIEKGKYNPFCNDLGFVGYCGGGYYSERRKNLYEEEELKKQLKLQAERRKYEEEELKKQLKLQEERRKYEEEERKREEEERKRKKKEEEELKEKLREKSLTLRNKHYHKLYAVIMYRNNNGIDWMVKGWYIIKPGDTVSFSFPGITNRTVYYNATCEDCGKHWGDGDSNGYVPTSSPAFLYYNSSHIGELENFTRVNLRNGDVTQNLIDS